MITVDCGRPPIRLGKIIAISCSALFLGVDHAEDVCLTPTGDLFFGGEIGQLYLGDPTTGVVRVLARRGSRSLGVAVDGDGIGYVCDPVEAVVRWVALDGDSAGTFSFGTPDRPLTHPNSIAFTPEGVAFFSDSGHWGSCDGSILSVDLDGVTRSASDQFAAFPNGLAVSPDGQYLYVAESEFGVSRSRIVGRELGPREELTRLGGVVPDGLTFCADGSVLITCYQPNQILCISGGGTIENLFADPVGADLVLPTNAAFYGANMSKLAVANLGARHVSVLDTPLTGVRPHWPSLRALRNGHRE